MNRSYRFDLDKAVAAWRHSLKHNPAFTADDLDELEQHVRDQVAALVAKGWTAQAAFRRAMREMGDYSTAEAEYRKVYWGKRRRRGEMLREFTWRIAMWKNYLKIAWRNMLREKGYAFINVFGLAVGIAFCTLIYLFVHDELTFDHFHTQGARIFRVEETVLDADGSIQGGSSRSGPIVLGPALQTDVPGIEQYIRFQNERHFVRARGASTEAIEEDVLFADPGVLDVFTFPLKEGNLATALAAPDNVVITETMAHAHFGDEDPVGRILQIRLDQTFEDFVVTGVAADVPGNSTIQFGILLPFSRLLMYKEAFRNNTESWHFYSPQTYVALTSGTTEQQVEANLPAFHRKYHEDVIARQREEGRYDSTSVPTYNLKPIREVHRTSGSDLDAYILSGIALAVLLLACINFMTLSVGRSARRAREVGVRKVVGAGRRQVMAQFWGEAFLLSGIALLLGLLLAAAFLPVFNNLTGKSLTPDMAVNGTTGLILALIVVVTGLIAGSYPALVLARFQPIETLANRLRLGKTSRFTQALVVLQFGFTVFLTTSTLIMARQLAYTRSMDLGFDKEQVVVIPTSGLDGGQVAERFRTMLEQQPSIVDVTASGNTLGRTGTMGLSFDVDGKHHLISVFRVDAHYLDFLNLDLVDGRNFNANLAIESRRSVIVNEGLVRDFAMEDPIGKPIPEPWAGPEEAPVIIGVVKDYHFQSLYQEVGSVMLTVDPGWEYENLLVRIRPEGIPQTLALLKKTWQATTADVPFTYHFLDDQMQAQYANDQHWSQIVRYAALFAVLIACLGLLGLAALSATRRTKEIGIRKVMGATVYHIVMLISKDLALLVVLGVLTASPVAYVVMHRWLDDFAYRIEISWPLFLIAGMAALGIALLTVSYQAVKAALADPVKSLRYE